MSPKLRHEDDLSTANLFTMLVTASYHGDNDTDNEGDDASVVCDMEEPSPLPAGWLKKGDRMEQRERRAERMKLRGRSFGSV